MAVVKIEVNDGDAIVYGERAKTEGYLYICDRYPKCDT